MISLNFLFIFKPSKTICDVNRIQIQKSTFAPIINPIHLKTSLSLFDPDCIIINMREINSITCRYQTQILLLYSVNNSPHLTSRAVQIPPMLEDFRLRLGQSVSPWQHCPYRKRWMVPINRNWASWICVINSQKRTSTPFCNEFASSILGWSEGKAS